MQRLSKSLLREVYTEAIILKIILALLPKLNHSETCDPRNPFLVIYPKPNFKSTRTFKVTLFALTSPVNNPVIP